MNAQQFELINTNPEYEYELIDTTLTLTLQALQADLDSFNPETLTGTIDVGGLEAGEYISVPVSLAVDSAYTVSQELIASVRIIDKNVQSEESKEETVTAQETSTDETQSPQETQELQETSSFASFEEEVE